MNDPLYLPETLLAVFLVGCVWCLACYRRRALLGVVIALTSVITIAFILQPIRDARDWMGFIKVMCELPLGLGVVVGFGLLARSKQQANIDGFSVFINIAVVGNILMMVFVPVEETWRGLVGRVACLLLVVWLLQEMSRARWKTVAYDDGIFTFNSSPLPWVLCHSCYRLGLITLPVFNSFRYVLLEPLSLFSMYLFYRANKRRREVNYYFGYADTLVVSSLAVCSRLFEYTSVWTPPPLYIHLSQRHLDLVFVPIQAGVCCYALVAIVSNVTRRPRSGSPS